MNSQRGRSRQRRRTQPDADAANATPGVPRVLLLGASGNIGSALAEEFMRRGWFVRALTRRASDVKVDVNEIFQADLMDEGTLRGMLSNVNMVFSAAGAPPSFATGLAAKYTYAQLDDFAHRRVLNMVLEAKVKRFGYVAPYGGRVLGRLEYIAAQESFVAALRSTDVQGLVVRTTPVFGSFDPLLRRAQKGKVRTIGDGDAEVNPVHTADLAVAVADAIEAGASDLDVGGPEVLTRRQIAEMALEAWGREPEVGRLRVPLAMFWGRLAMFRGRHNRAWSQYISASSLTDIVAPEYGTRKLADYFSERVVELGAEAEARPPRRWWRLGR